MKRRADPECDMKFEPKSVAHSFCSDECRLMRPLNMVIDVLVAYSVRNKGYMFRVYNWLKHRLEPYKAEPFSTREEAVLYRQLLQ